MELTENKKKTLRIIGNVAFWVVLALVVFYSALSLFSEKDENMTSLFGTSAMSVQSDSMVPAFKKGDLIFIDTTFDYATLEEGDVITYSMQVEIEGEIFTIYNSHRIDTINVVDGAYWFYTKGDNNPSADINPVVGNDIIGVWKGTKLAGFGTFIDGLVTFLKSSLGFFLFIVMPCFGFLVYEIVRFIKVVSEYNVQKAVGNREQIQLDAIAIARAQIEAEQKAKLEAEKK